VWRVAEWGRKRGEKRKSERNNTTSSSSLSSKAVQLYTSSWPETKRKKKVDGKFYIVHAYQRKKKEKKATPFVSFA